MTSKTKMTILRFLSELKSKVRIPIEKGDLGLDIDDPIKKYKKQIINGKDWDEMSQQINALVIFNKNKHPEISAKWERKRQAIARWIESKRKDNPDFGK